MNDYLRIIKIIESDPARMKALRAVQRLDLPDWLIGAGFVRNAIWDNVYNQTTKINDIDVVYFSKRSTSEDQDLVFEKQLKNIEPSFPWSVKNQARMHLRNKDQAYKDTLDAMQHWPEKQTSLGVMLDHNNIIIKHCFDLSFQFNGKINRNKKKAIDVFENRIREKQWQKIWPSLQIET